MIAFVRSYYSFDSGFCSPQEAVDLSVQAGATSLAFCDRGEWAGYLEFVRAAEGHALPVMPGIEVALDHAGDPRPALLFATRPETVPALFEATCQEKSASGLPVVPTSSLRRGFLVISGIPESHIESFAWKHDSAGAIDFAAAIRATRAGFAIGVPPGGDLHMAAFTEAVSRSARIFPLHLGIHGSDQRDSYLACRSAVFSEQEPVPSCCFGPPADISDADRATLKDLESRFAFRLPAPAAPEPPPAADADLRDMCEDALSLYLSNVEHLNRRSVTPARRLAYRQRLDLELESISKAGAAESLLSLCHMRERMRAASIPALARGSANNSLTCFLLDLAQVNPLIEGLSPDRFCGPDRSRIPDVDLDVPIEAASPARVSLRESGFFGLRSVIRDGALASLSRSCSKPDYAPSRSRFLGSDLKALCKEAGFELSGASIQEARKAIPDFDTKFLALRPGEEGRMGALLSSMEFFDGRPTSIIAHPGIADCRVPLPLVQTAEGPSLSIPHDQAAPFLTAKLDILPNADLSILEAVSARLRERGEAPIPHAAHCLSERHWSTIFDAGLVAGLPHVHNYGALARRSRLRSRADLSAFLALIRLSSQPEILDAFTSGFSSPPEALPQQVAARFADITGSTRGLVLYDQQFIDLAKEFCGATASEADQMRKAPRDSRSALTAGAIRSGLSEEAASALVLAMSQAPYFFNQGHATAYSYLTCQLAFAKAEYPAEFFLAASARREGSSLARLAFDTRALGTHILLGDGPSRIDGETRDSITRRDRPSVIIAQEDFQAPDPTTFFKSFGFLTDNHHPGFPAVRTISSLRFVNRKNQTSATAFVDEAFTPPPAKDYAIVRAKLSTRLGEEPVVATRFFRGPNMSQEAAAFCERLQSFGDKPVVIHLEINPKDGRTFLNLLDVSPPPPDRVTCIEHVRRAYAAHRPPVQNIQEIPSH